MRRVVVAFVVLLLVAVPAAQAARPSVAFKRKTVTRSASGARITTLPRGRALQFDVAYVVRNISAKVKTARAQVFVTLSQGPNVLRLRTTKARTSSGTWRWVLKGAKVRIPVTYPTGTYVVRVRVVISRGSRRLSQAQHAWRATVT
jgi:hypothetical protein